MTENRLVKTESATEQLRKLNITMLLISGALLGLMITAVNGVHIIEKAIRDIKPTINITQPKTKAPLPDPITKW